MSYTDILYSVDDFVATITLNRPDKLNAWTSEMDADLHHAIERAAADDAVRAIVITGAGRGFCAGADMSRLSRLSAGETPRAIVGANGSKPGNFEQKFCTEIAARSRVSALMGRLRRRVEEQQASEEKLRALLHRLTKFEAL